MKSELSIEKTVMFVIGILLIFAIPINAFALNDQALSKEFWSNNNSVSIVRVNRQGEKGNLQAVIKYYEDESGDFYSFISAKENTLSEKNDDVRVVYGITTNDLDYSVAIDSRGINEADNYSDFKSVSQNFFYSNNEHIGYYISAIHFAKNQPRTISISIYINGRIYSSLVTNIPISKEVTTTKKQKSSTTKGTTLAGETPKITTEAQTQFDMQITTANNQKSAGSNANQVADTTLYNGEPTTLAQTTALENGVVQNNADFVETASSMTDSARVGFSIGVSILGVGILVLALSFFIKNKSNVNNTKNE